MPFKADVYQCQLAKGDLYMTAFKILHLSSLPFSPASFRQDMLTQYNKLCLKWKGIFCRRKKK